MKKFIIRYGLTGGSLSIALGLLNWFFIAPMGYAASQWLGYFSIIISMLCIPLGVRYFRDKLNGGKVSFGESFRVGMGITVVASVVVMLYSIIFFLVEGDKFDSWREEGLTTEAKAQMASMPDYVMSPLFQGLIMFLTVMLIGLIINIISALALKKQSATTA